MAGRRVECSERIQDLGTRLTVQRFDIGEVGFSCGGGWKRTYGAASEALPQETGRNR